MMYGFNIKNWYRALRPVKDGILQWEMQAVRGNGGGGGAKELYSSLNQFISQLRAEDDC